MPLVARRIEQRRGSGDNDCHQLIQQRPLGFAIQFRAIPLLEFGPAIGAMIEPAAQTGARRNLFEPVIDRGGLLGQAARLEAVDQDTAAVSVLLRFVGAFDVEGGHYHCF